MYKAIYLRIFSILFLFVVGIILILNLFTYKSKFNTNKFILYESKYLDINDKHKYISLSTNAKNLTNYNINNNLSGTGIIFYPGAFIDEKAYLPLLSELAKEGMDVYILKSFLNLGLFTENGLKNILNSGLSEKYILMGHSLGGTKVLKDIYNKDKYENFIKGIVLLSSYGSDRYDFSDKNINFMYIVGTSDGIIDIDKYENYKSMLPTNTRYVLINGGNHSYFGNYGIQSKDLESDITLEEQQFRVIEEILKFEKEI